MPTQDTKDLIIARLQHAEEVYNNGGNAAGATDASDYATYIGGANVSYDEAHTLELYFRAGTSLTDALDSMQDGGTPGPIDPSNPDDGSVNPDPPQPIDPPDPPQPIVPPDPSQPIDPPNPPQPVDPPENGGDDNGDDDDGGGDDGGGE